MKRALDEAAHWCARLQAPDCSSQQHRQFQQWLQAHPDNVEAYAMAEALCWGLQERVESDERLTAMVDRALAMGVDHSDYPEEGIEREDISVASKQAASDDSKKSYDQVDRKSDRLSRNSVRTEFEGFRDKKIIRFPAVQGLESLKSRSIRAMNLAPEKPAVIPGNERGFSAHNSPSQKDSSPARKSAFRFRLKMPLAAAASVMMVALLGGLKIPNFTTSEVLRYTSSKSEQLTVKLQDGTHTQLDVNSVVNVKMTTESRTVELLRGRAIFDVAHDQNRPFSVTVGDSQVVALGTRFQVQRDDQKMVVTLEEGLVDVIGTSSGIVKRQHLNPGDQLKVDLSASSPWERSRVEVDTVTSWSRGRHVFRNAQLAEALDEINRYATAKIRLGDPNLEEMEVSGNFVIGDSRLVASAFVAALPLRMVDIGTELILFPVHSASLSEESGG